MRSCAVLRIDGAGQNDRAFASLDQGSGFFLRFAIVCRSTARGRLIYRPDRMTGRPIALFAPRSHPNRARRMATKIAMTGFLSVARENQQWLTMRYRMW